MAVSRFVSDVFANDEPYIDFKNPGHTLLLTFSSFSPMGMLGEACLSSNAYYADARLHPLFWVLVCWSEHSDSSFVYGFMSLDYNLGTMTTTTYLDWFSFGPPWFNYWFSFTLAYSRISHEYSSLFIIVINLIFVFSLWCIDWVGSLYANRIFMCFCIKSSIGTQGEVS